MEEISVVVGTKLGSIDFDFEALKKSVEEVSSSYKGIIVTEDTIANSKNDVVYLRKLKGQLDDKRKQVKTTYLEPLTEFETKIKEATALIDAPILELTAQMDQYEADRKLSKKKDIEKLYETLMDDDIREYVPLNKLYQSKWENKTVTLKSIENELTSTIESARMSVETIKNMNSDATDKALALFKQEMNLPNAIALINKYEIEKIQILERERAKKEREALEQARREEQERINAERIRAEQERINVERIRAEQEASKLKESTPLTLFEAVNEDETDEAPAFEVEAPAFVEPKKLVRFEINATWSQYDDFKSYLKSKSIEFKEV